jgi:hypothetical protein
MKCPSSSKTLQPYQEVADDKICGVAEARHAEHAILSPSIAQDSHSLDFALVILSDHPAPGPSAADASIGSPMCGAMISPV